MSEKNFLTKTLAETMLTRRSFLNGVPPWEVQQHWPGDCLMV